MSRIAVVAFSGGLDTSCIVSWLKEDWYGFDEVVAVLVDVGQEFDLEASIERGRAAGADDVILVDRKAAFAEEQCARAIKTNALYEGKYPLVSALSRPVIAQAVAELAVELGAEAVVHGCTGKGNDQLRFELSFKATDPGLHVIAPLRDRIWTRDEEIDYALDKGIPSRRRRRRRSRSTRTSSAARSRRACSRTLGGAADEPYALTSDPSSAPEPVEVTIGFTAGVPVSLDGEELPLAELIARLNALAGAYGIGRFDMIENRAVGIKSREVYEALRDRPDRGAFGARGRRPDQGRGPDQARARAALDRAALRGALVQPGARGDRRLRRRDAGARRGRRSRLPASERRGRHRPSLAAHALRGAAGVAWRAARRSPTRPPRASSRSPRSRSSSRPPASGRRRTHDALGGRVGRALDPAVAAFLRADDAELLPYDCEATAVHARRLHAAGLLDADELAEAESRLAEIAVGGGIEPEDEDVHTAIERLLGDVGGKIHAGGHETTRSAAAFRLYVGNAARRRGRRSQRSRPRSSIAEADAETPMPGYTHLQRAQPVTVGHHLLAWVEMLERDLVRLCRRRGSRGGEPARGRRARRLDSAAARARKPAPELARRGRRPRLRARLPLRGHGLLRPPLQDRRGARALDDSEFGFARLGEDAATGSSMMPQKLNPDVAELARASRARRSGVRPGSWRR